MTQATDENWETRGPRIVNRFFDWAFGVPRKYHQRQPDWFWRGVSWVEHRFFCNFCIGAREVLREMKARRA